MIFFKPKHHVCDTCKVLFEPPTDHEGLWDNFCYTHREPRIKAHDRRMSILRWVDNHLNLVESLMMEESKKEQANSMMTQQNAMGLFAQSQAAQAAQAAQSQNFGLGLGPLQGPKC